MDKKSTKNDKQGQTDKNAGALPLDKTSPRGIMKIQKGAVDLTVGPTWITKMLTVRGTAGRSTSF